MRRPPLLVLAFAIVAACEGGGGEASIPGCTDRRDDDVREAAIRWLMTQTAPEAEGIWCVGISHGEAVDRRGADPDPAFLERFEEVSPSVEAESHCTSAEGAVTDSEGDRSALLRVGEVCRDGATARASGSWEVDGRAGAGIRMRLAPSSGDAWEVVEHELLFIY